MRPFILTESQAGKLPRWGLLTLCLLYAIPGLVGRDPWRPDDSAGFGVALAMIRGTLVDWLIPNIAGEVQYETGPLPFWPAALAGRLLPFVVEHAIVCAGALAWLALTFVVFWYASWGLAKRPGVQPSDPFGVSASRVDVGRAVADSGLLLLLATFGLIARLHETTAAAAQVTWTTLFLFGMSLALDFPRRGGTLAGVAIAASVLTRGLSPALPLLAVLLIAPMVSISYRLIAGRLLLAGIVSCGVMLLAWLGALEAIGSSGRAYLEDWWRHQVSTLSGPTLRALSYDARTLPWFFWPAWPIAGWALWRWRGRMQEPAVMVPALTILALTLAALVSPVGRESLWMPVAPPMAMLASMGLPTLRRAIVSLIDWFAVMTATLVGFAAWAYWIALMTGFPPTMSMKARQLAPGFQPDWVIDEIVLGLFATLAWLLLVRWRVSRQPPMIWRAVVLSAGGLVLAWFLLMTLWLPVFNERNTYRDLSVRTALALPAGYDCVTARELGQTERTSLAYFGSVRFGPPERCSWLLIQDKGPIARLFAPDETGWAFVWQGSRPRDQDERYRLYRRRP